MGASGSDLTQFTRDSRVFHAEHLHESRVSCAFGRPHSIAHLHLAEFITTALFVIALVIRVRAPSTAEHIIGAKRRAF